MDFAKKIFLFLVMLSNSLSYAQQKPSVGGLQNGAMSWTSNPFEHFVFIENKGQLDATDIKHEGFVNNLNIIYSADISGVQAYFTSTGITYRHDEYKKLLSERDRERRERKGKLKHEDVVKTTSHYLDAEWVGANTSAVLSEEPQSFYYTYPSDKDKGKTTFKAECYKKIIYKNMYPGIDVEYILPEKGGIKYSLVIHPGADISKAKLKYLNAEKIRSDRQGNILITSAFGEFIEHAPQTFLAESKSSLNSFYKLDKNEITFTTADYDHTKELIIDPWTSSPSFSFNRAYDINYDVAGNVYVYGSYSPYKLAKFNNAGALQWMFAGSNVCYYGDLAVDESNGTSYIFAAFPSTAVKVNTLGIQLGYSDTVSNIMNEIWRAEYSRCLKKIVLGGGGTAANYQAVMLDTTLASFTPVNVFGSATAFRDVALLATDPNSSACYMAVAYSSLNDGLFNNTMIKFPMPSFTPTTWTVPNNGHSFTETGIPYAPSMLGGDNGFNGMACGPTYLYTYDGNVLKKWNKNTGAWISQVSTGGSMFNTGGLTADKCDNVYAGVGGTIYEYNSSLTLIATYGTAGTCYDLKLGPNNKLYACGAGFVSEFNVPALPPPTAVSTPSTGGCNVCNGTATALPCGDPAGFSYMWSPGGQTTQVATGLCPGTYTVSIMRACSDIDTVSVTVTGGSGTIVTSITKVNACSNAGSATITASGGAGPYTYLWSNGQTTATATNLAAGNYTVTATDANGCKSIRVVQITNKINVMCTPLTGCSSGSNGSINLNVTGGTPSYLYKWNNGQTGSVAVGIPAGNYTVSVTDANGCTQTQTCTLNPAVPLAIQVDHSNLCLTYTIKPDAAVTSTNGGTAPYTYNWSNGETTQHNYNLPAGVYYVTVTDAAGCSVVSSVNITTDNTIDASFIQSPPGTVCVGATIYFTNTGSSGPLIGDNWYVGNYLGYSKSVNYSYTFLTPGNFTVNHYVYSAFGGGCSNTVTSTVTVIACPLNVTSTGSTICSGNCGSVKSSASGGKPPYVYLWSTGETSQNITPCPVANTTYTVTVTDALGAAVTTTALLNVNSCGCTLAGQFTKGTANCPGCGCKEWIMVTGIGGTSPYAYTWPDGYNARYKNNICPGAYTINIKDKNGCSVNVNLSAP